MTLNQKKRAQISVKQKHSPKEKYSATLKISIRVWKLKSAKS